MRIGNIEIKNPTFLAPLAGFTDVGFRAVCKKYGAGLSYTEMVSAKGLLYDNNRTKELLVTTEAEEISAVQLFGGEPDVLARAVQHDALKKFDIIDINMGCPVPKIVGNGEGSALIKNIPQAKTVIKSAVQNTDKPITVKFRIGFYEGENIAVEFAKACEDAGASAITVHGRTRAQFYSGKADWQAIAEVKRNVGIPVIANGDVASKADYDKIREVTGCDGVMIGRGALGKPSIFAEILGKPFEANDYGDLVLHIEILSKFFPDKIVANLMKKHVCYYAKGKSFSKAVKLEIVRINTAEEALQIVQRYFKK